MKRILFLTERFPPDLGGVATSSGRIAGALAGLGVGVDVVAWTRSLQPGQVARLEGSPQVFRIGRYREWDTTMQHTLNLCDWLFSMQQYDAVWGHYLTPAGLFAVSLARLKGVRSTVSIRGNDLDREMYPPGDFARLYWTLQNAEVITTVTHELGKKVAALSDRQDSLYLPNAVDSETFHPSPPDPALRLKLGIGEQEVVLGFAGELREKKGQAFLLEALGRLRELRPARLLIIGEVRPSQLPELLSPQEHGIVITGQLTSPAAVNAHLQLCDVFLQPSLWDGMPNALLEAMAAGCGCIASDAGGIPEIIDPGVDGVILPRWQLHRLADAVTEWLGASEVDRQRIRDAARQKVIREFGFAQERQRLQSVLARLMPSAS